MARRPKLYKPTHLHVDGRGGRSAALLAWLALPAAAGELLQPVRWSKRAGERRREGNAATADGKAMIDGIGLATAFATGSVCLLSRRVLPLVPAYASFVAGAIMILMGVAMLTGKLTTFGYWQPQQFPILGRIG